MELLMFALTEEGPPAWMRQIVSHLEGDRWAYGTCWPHAISSSPPAVRYCHAVMLKHVLFPFSKLHQIMQICLLRYWQIGETFFDNELCSNYLKGSFVLYVIFNKIKEENEGEHSIFLVSWSTFLQLCGELRPLPHMEIVEDKILFKNQSS